MSLPDYDTDALGEAGKAPKVQKLVLSRGKRRANRRPGVETYQNMLRVLFVLRDAPLVDFRDPADNIRAMTASKITEMLHSQSDPPSVSTVRKYLYQLEYQNPSQIEVLHDTPGRENYWRLKASSPLNRKGLSDFEAAMVCLASELLEPLLPPQLQNQLKISRERAEEMLINARPIGAMPDDSPFWMLKLVNRIWIEPPPPIPPQVLDAVFKAVGARKRLIIQYQSLGEKRDGKPASTVNLSPFRLVQHSDARLYLIATDMREIGSLAPHNSQPEGYRRFAMHRILSAVILDEAVITSKQLEHLIDSQPGFDWRGKAKMVAMINTEIALRLNESPINDTQHVYYEAGSVWHRLEVEVDLNWELRWWILSNGANIIIHEPESLREEIFSHFRVGEAIYRTMPRSEQAM
jgi:predicted DNA-binding transcriptional regulator YafY